MAGRTVLVRSHGVRGTWVIAVAGVLAVPTALPASSTVASFGGIPSESAALQPAGTNLGNGFSVAKGTALVGDVFPIPVVYPYRGEPIIDRGWRAILLVKGDPRKVMVSYRAQASAAGMELRSAATLCDFDRTNTKAYECFAAGVNDSPDDPRRVSLSLRRGPGLFGPMSHLTIVYNDPDPPGGVFLDSTLSTAATPGPEPPPVPNEWGRLARPGDFLFGDSYKPPGGWVPPPLKVEPDSTAAAAVGPAGNAGSSDWRSVLRVTGDPRKIVSAYRRQLRLRARTFGNLSRTVTTHPYPGTTMYEFSTQLVGGWDHHIEIVHRSRGDWMLVSAYAQT